ncbi:UPF0739 protein C1orf74 homolog [Oculina patagonica]
MADTGGWSLRQWKDIFQKYLGKLSDKYCRSFLLDLAAIYLGIKPSLLFDYAVVDTTKASILIDTLAAKGLVPYSSDVLKVGEDIFFADLENLVSHLKKTLDSEELTLIDISGKLQEPRVLETDVSKRVMKQFARIVENLDQKLYDATLTLTQRNKTTRNSEVVDLKNGSDVEEDLCIPSVFGFLLGYPVIYWCDQASEYNCLNMVPLNRYMVSLKESSLIFHSHMLNCTGSLIQAGSERVENCGVHTVFSFTAPVALESHYESTVSRWINSIHSMGETLGIGEHLTVKKETVTFPQVTL